MKTILIHSLPEFCVRYLAMSATTFIDLSSTKIYSCLHCSKFYCCSGSGSRDLLTVPGLTKCSGWAFSEKSLTVLMCSLMLILEPVTHSAVYCQEEIKTRVRGLESKKALGDLLLTPVRLGQEFFTSQCFKTLLGIDEWWHCNFIRVKTRSNRV